MKSGVCTYYNLWNWELWNLFISSFTILSYLWQYLSRQNCKRGDKKVPKFGHLKWNVPCSYAVTFLLFCFPEENKSLRILKFYWLWTISCFVCSLYEDSDPEKKFVIIALNVVHSNKIIHKEKNSKYFSWDRMELWNELYLVFPSESSEFIKILNLFIE